MGNISSSSSGGFWWSIFLGIIMAPFTCGISPCSYTLPGNIPGIIPGTLPDDKHSGLCPDHDTQSGNFNL